MVRKSILISILSVAFLIGCIHTPFYYWSLEAQKGIYHKIEKGQTLWRIAKTYGVSVEELIRVNRIKDVTKIKIGQQIFIPGATKRLKVEVYIPPQKSSLPKYTKSFIWPVEGKVISKFGRRGNSMHNGIDIKAKIGTPIKAAKDGIVTYSQSTLRGYGNAIIITHEDDFTTLYAHNLVNLVKEKQKVKQGEIIAKVGQTGRATTPHLHFEIWKGLIAQDPYIYLP
jgi:murein DD-endopeptidase MepM/ murein hydrolase activator NlpD